MSQQADLEKPAEPEVDRPAPADQAVSGDFGGAYGYGHPAHRPDPDARYSFNPNSLRVLPVDKRSRWR